MTNITYFSVIYQRLFIPLMTANPKFENLSHITEIHIPIYPILFS